MKHIIAAVLFAAAVTATLTLSANVAERQMIAAAAESAYWLKTDTGLKIYMYVTPCTDDTAKSQNYLFKAYIIKGDEVIGQTCYSVDPDSNSILMYRQTETGRHTIEFYSIGEIHRLDLTK